MNFEKLNQWTTLIANIGVVVGIVFLAIELRSNTASNRIAIEAVWSSNWVNINASVAQNLELAITIAKVEDGEVLSRGEEVQVANYIRQVASQGAMMRRLYTQGFATRADVEEAHRGLRARAEHEGFRKVIAELGTSGPIVLEPDGLEKWFEAQE